MSEADAVLHQIGQAVELANAGDRDAARIRLAGLWAEIQGDANSCCALAHYMADLQDDPREELRWDLLALEAARAMPEESARMYFPSLYLNLAEDYRKLDDAIAARECLALANAAAGALPENGYGAMIRRGIAHLREQIESRT